MGDGRTTEHTVRLDANGRVKGWSIVEIDWWDPAREMEDLVIAILKEASEKFTRVGHMWPQYEETLCDCQRAVRRLYDPEGRDEPPKITDLEWLRWRASDPCWTPWCTPCGIYRAMWIAANE